MTERLSRNKNMEEWWRGQTRCRGKVRGSRCYGPQGRGRYVVWGLQGEDPFDR